MVKLSDVCDVRDGTHDSPKYVEYGYPLVTSKNIKDGQLDLSIVNFITEEDYNKINERSKVDVGDIIMPMIGTIGNPYLVEEFCDFAIKNVALIKCDNIKVINKFVWYFLQSNAFERYVDTKNKGGTQKFLSLGDIRAIELPEVSIDKQKHIVEILTRVDGIVAKRKQQLQKLDELVKARFVEMFGNPEEVSTKWEKTTFSSVCVDMHQGINTVADKVEYVENGFPIIQSKNITSGYLDLNDIRFVKESDYERYREKYNPKQHDLLVCNIGTIGKSLVVERDIDFLIAWNIFLIKLNRELVNPIFVKVFMELLNQQNYFEKYMTGGTVKFINKKTMGNISTPVPPMDVQNQFADFVQQIDKSKLDVQKSLDKLETLKKALMQKYFG